MAVSKIIQYLFFTFNFVFYMGGVVVFCLAVYAKNNPADYHISQGLVRSVDLLIVISTVTSVLGFLAFYGAVRRNSFALAIFFMAMVALFFMLVVVGALGAVARTPAGREAVRDNLRQLLPLGRQRAEIKESFQKVEAAGFCCGFLLGHADWGNGSATVPNSCNCTDVSRNCTDVDGRQVYATPCLNYIMGWLDRVSVSLVAVVFVFGASMVLAMSFSCVLSYQFFKADGFI